MPAVTTITGRYQDKEALMFWANKMGLQDITLAEARKGSTTAGKICHAMIRAKILGQPYAPPGWQSSGLSEQDYAAAIEAAERGFAAFLNWYHGVEFEVIETEQPLISEIHQYGGRLDCVARIDGDLTIVDWKATNAIYTADVIQLAAYVGLWDEHHPKDRAKRALILRVGKDDAEFEDEWFGPKVLAVAQEEFLLWKNAHVTEAELRKALKKRAA